MQYTQAVNALGVFLYSAPREDNIISRVALKV